MPITSETRLREIYGPPIPRSVTKEIDRLDIHARAFIAKSPFLLLSSSDGIRIDVSPKGDRPGFVVVEDDERLLIPDWPGNSRIDGLRNVLMHDHVGLIFLIPSVRETLRVNGRATIHEEPELLEQCALMGRLPLTVLRVAVEEVFLHCAKALLRSHLWQADTWPETRPIPTMSEMIRDMAGDPEIAYESDSAMTERYLGILEKEGR